MIRSIHTCLLVTALVISNVCYVHAQEVKDGESLYWIFLVTGKSAAGVKPEAIQAMQQAHVGNFGVLAKAGQLFLAGPMSDPEKVKRGIILAKAESREALDKLFDADPYVKEGYMKLDAWKMQLGVGKANPNIETTKLAKYRLVTLNRVATEPLKPNEAMINSNLEYCKSIYDLQRLRFAGMTQREDSPMMGVMIFKDLESTELDRLVSEVPAVKAGHLKPTTYLLYMSEGVLD